MRKSLAMLCVLLLLAVFMMPVVALATDGGPDEATLFSLDLVTVALLVGATVAVSDFLKDMSGLSAVTEPWAKSATLAVVLGVGVALTLLVSVYDKSWMLDALMIAAAAAGYYKIGTRRRQE